MSGGKKLPRIRSRITSSDIVVLNEVNKFADEDLIAGCKFGKISNTPNPDRTGPGFGTFLGSKKFNADKGDRFIRHDKFEIILCLRYFDNFKVCIIGVYRSPNMDNLDSDMFYAELEKMIAQHKSSVDVLLVLGDDNSHNDAKSSSKARRAFKKLEELRVKHKGYQVVNKNTRKNHQTDHVVAFYDVFHYDVRAVTTPGVADHDEINVTISSASIKPDPIKICTYEVVTDEGNPEVLAQNLEEQLASVNLSLARSFEASEVRPFGPLQHDLNQMLTMFRGGIERARKLCRTTVKRRMPVASAAEPLKSREERHLQYIRNKISACEQKLLKSPSESNKQKLDNLRSDHQAAQESAAKAIVLRDMQHMHKFQKHDSRRFFDATGKQLKSDQLAASLSKEEVKDKLEKAEDNYKLRGPPLSRSDWDHIVPDKQFRIPYSVKDVEEAILGAKKTDSFYKRFAKQIAPAFSAIMYLVSKYFLIPTECKVLKLTFLKTRTIFSCSFETRILETLVKKGLDEAMPPDDTGQMAYQKGRSTGLCVAIGLNEAEKLDDLGFQWSADQKKAFDSARWAPICQVYQQKAGAGEFTYQYFKNRNYRYNGELGFKRFPMGRGTPPGDLISPDQFISFQSTDKSMTLANPTWKWPGPFSDDKMPTTSWENVKNGKVQEALDQTWRWSQDNYVDYHLTGDKAPEYYILRKATDQSTIDPIRLLLGTTEIKRAYETCQLGISIEYFRDDEPTNQYGYKLVWKSKKSPFSRLAYRFQDIRNWWDPEMRWKCVDSYVVGKLGYAASLYWLRADPKQVDEVRFQYCMALASVAGLETPEAISLRTCKKQAVAMKNASYLKLCKFLNMPTLRDMAIMDARVLLRQWRDYRPELFRLGEAREILDILDHEKGCLLYDLFKLSKEPVNNWYPAYREYCLKRKTSKSPVVIAQEDKPLWRQYWEETKSLSGEHEHDFRQRLFQMACRDFFEVAEPYARVRKQLDQATLIPKNRRTRDVSEMESDAFEEPATKRPRSSREHTLKKRKKRIRDAPDTSEAIVHAPVSHLSCEIGHPPVRGVKNRTCRICGYVIRTPTSKIKVKGCLAVKFDCCEKEAHLDCWQNARLDENASLLCTNARYWLSSDKVTPKTVKLTSEASDQSTVPCRECEFCHDLIEISDKNRYHLFEHCGLEQNCTSGEPQQKRRKGVVSVVGRYYELLRGQTDPGNEHQYGIGSNRAESPAIAPDRDRGAIAEIGVT